MPHEGKPHKGTWMGFASDPSLWKNDLKKAQKDIVFLAKTIAKYEPVNMIVASNEEMALANNLLEETNN